MPDLLSNGPDLTIDMQHFAVKCAFTIQGLFRKEYNGITAAGNPGFELRKMFDEYQYISDIPTQFIKTGLEFFIYLNYKIVVYG